MTTPVELPFQSDPIKVGGRTFVISRDTTYEQDVYVLSIVQRAGLADIAGQFNIMDVNDQLDRITMQIIATAYEHGQLFLMLGAIVEEEGTEWTKESAIANAKFFSKLKSREDKEALQGAIVTGLLGFFVSGLLSSKTFRNSSGSQQTLSDVRLEPLPSEPSESTPEAAPTTDSGIPSLESSPDSIQTSMPLSSSGESAKD